MPCRGARGHAGFMVKDSCPSACDDVAGTETSNRPGVNRRTSRPYYLRYWLAVPARRTFQEGGLRYDGRRSSLGSEGSLFWHWQVESIAESHGTVWFTTAGRGARLEASTPLAVEGAEEDRLDTADGGWIGARDWDILQRRLGSGISPDAARKEESDESENGCLDHLCGCRETNAGARKLKIDS